MKLPTILPKGRGVDRLWVQSLCILLLQLLAIGAAAQCLPLAVRNPEGNYIIPGAKGDIVYRRVDGIELSMDAYVQPRGGRRPGVMVIHGGNGDTGSRVAFVGQFLETLTQAGYNWFSVDYRLGGPAKAPDALGDLRAALDFIRCHAREFQIDANNLALLGEDAGAHLAAMLAAERPAGVKAAALLGGLYAQRASVNSKSMPATLVVHGTNDREASPEQARAFCDAIRAGSGSCAFHPVEGASHRPENWWPNQWGYKQAVVSWLAEQLKWKGSAPAAMKTRLQKDLVFDAERGLKLDAWTPSGPGPFPAVIIAHGGGWEAGDKVTYVTPLFEPLAKAGIAWFSIDYRLTPQVRHEEQLVDFRRAIRYVRENAKRFRVDPNRLVILGESASGQMAAQLATEAPEGVIGVVSFYGVYDFNALVTEFAPRSIPARLFGAQSLDERARAAMKRYSPIENLRPNMPPMLLIHGTNERLHAQGVAMARRLAAMRAPHEFLEVEGAPHGIENWEGHPQWMGYKKRLVEWVKAQFAARR
ncbi:MAG: alpha/beta hydrolase [Blastocatellia bacterium]|nr:alpha/beta hydrolase [Blastocatellia bacterium]